MPSDDEYMDALRTAAAKAPVLHGVVCGYCGNDLIKSGAQHWPDCPHPKLFMAAERWAASLAREARLKEVALRAADYHTMSAQAYHETYGGDERDPGLFVPELIAAAARR